MFHVESYKAYCIANEGRVDLNGMILPAIRISWMPDLGFLVVWELSESRLSVCGRSVDSEPQWEVAKFVSAHDKSTAIIRAGAILSDRVNEIEGIQEMEDRATEEDFKHRATVAIPDHF